MFKSMWWSHIPNLELIPVIVGAEPDPTEDEKKLENQDGTGGAGGSQQQGDPNDGGGDDRDPQKKISALTEEKDRFWTKAQEAERKLQETADELEELRKFKQTADDAKLTTDEKTARELETLNKTVEDQNAVIEGLKESARKLVLNNAFLGQTEVKFHNAERALALADLSEVEIIEGKDGIPVLKDPNKLTAAIKALAASDSYLVDTSSEKAPLWDGKTGDKPLQKKAPADAAKKDKLLKDYPALRR